MVAAKALCAVFEVIILHVLFEELEVVFLSDSFVLIFEAVDVTLSEVMLEDDFNVDDIIVTETVGEGVVFTDDAGVDADILATVETELTGSCSTTFFTFASDLVWLACSLEPLGLSNNDGGN